MTDEQLSRDFQALEVDDEPNPAFADALFAELESEAVARRAPGATWILLAAAALIAVLAVGAALGSGLVQLPFLIAEASQTPTPSASASATGAETESAEPTPTATALPTPSATSPIAFDSVVRIVVTDLSLRRAPSLEGERLGGLHGDGTAAFVVAGPVIADGYEWYQLSALGIPPQSGCIAPPTEALDECPNWFGWVAGREAGGDYWLEPTTLDCPAMPVNMGDLAPGRGGVERLACNPDGTVTVRGFWAGPADAGADTCAASEHSSGWLYCRMLNDVSVWTDSGGPNRGNGLQVFFDPAVGVEMPEPGGWVEIVGHFDDPAAQGCAEAAALDNHPEEGEQAVLTCRSELVVKSVTPVSGPF